MCASRLPDPRFKEIAHERVSERVARELMRLIAEGRLAPGERLPGERALATMMGVSRVSVRAALQQLKARGLLSAVQGGGTRLLSSAGHIDPGLSALIRVDAANLHDLAEIRAILEVWAARRAALRATSAQRAEIEDLYARMSDPARAGRYKSADDVAFHLAIAKAAASPVYMHLLTTLRDILTAMLDYHRYELFGSPEDDAEILRQHGAIATAIRRGEGEAAAEAMGAHLAWVLERYDTARHRQSRRVPQAAQ
jgi:DNA-binding FadR family transcriptional regulator